MERKKEYRGEILSAIISIVVIFLLWGGSWYYIDNLVAPSAKNVSIEDARGTFGDKFGAINSLFAGLAFAGIIFTILLQRKELQLQRDELASTREVFEKQNDMLSQEKFENTYFQMLSLFHSIVNSIDIRRNNSEIIVKTGRDCFQTFYKELNREVESIISEENSKIDIIVQGYISFDDLPIELYIKAYGKIYEKHRSDLSHYFRTFYHIIKLIDNSQLNSKKSYASIARAQLSSYEQLMLFYNCLHENGKEKFHPLIEKYALFKNIDRSLLFSKNHLSQYSEGAYGK